MSSISYVNEHPRRGKVLGMGRCKTYFEAENPGMCLRIIFKAMSKRRMPLHCCRNFYFHGRAINQGATRGGNLRPYTHSNNEKDKRLSREYSRAEVHMSQRYEAHS